MKRASREQHFKYERRKEDHMRAARYRFACGLRVHASRGEATSAMHRLIASGKAHDTENLNVFKCESCNGWHVGHSVRDKRRHEA